MSATIVKLVALGSIFYDWKRNTRYPRVKSFDPKDAENRGLIESLIETKGFSPSLAPVIASPITPAELKLAMIALQAWWDDLKAHKDDGPKDEGMRRLIAWEAAHVVKGKLIEPELMGATGNRRWFALHEAYAKMFRDSKFDLNELNKIEFSLNVPVHVIAFKSDTERLGKQLEENELRDTGVVNTTYVDNLYSIQARMPEGTITQQFLRESMGATSGQKYWHFLKLANAFPEQNFIKRVCGEAPYTQEAGVSGGYLSWGRIGSKFSELVKISTAADPVLLDKYNSNVEKTGKGDKLTPLTTGEEVNNAIVGLMTESTGNKKKMMERKAIEGIASSNARIDSLMAKKVLNADEGKSAERLGQERVALNAVDTLFDDTSVFPIVESFLDRLASSDAPTRGFVMGQLAKVSFDAPVAAPAKAKGKGKK